MEALGYPLAVLSGVLLALSFPRFGYPALAWVSLTPLLIALVWPAPPAARRAFGLGLVTGAVYFAGTMYWTPAVLTTFGGLNTIVAIAAGALLVAYLALFPALFAVLTARVCAGLGIRGLLVAPAIWVSTELLRRWVLGGFPWVLLGYSQASVLSILQTASLAGVYGLSALVVAGSVGIAVAVRGTGRMRIAAPVVVAAVIAALAWWGGSRVRDASLLSQGEAIRVALVQGNIRQDEKWDPGQAARILDTYLDLTRSAARQGASLVVWPESSTPFLFEHDIAGNAAVRQVARELGVSLLFGSDQFEPGPPRRFFNSAFLVTPTGETAAVYRKMHLVPFGEYVPLKRLLFFIGPLVEAVSDFSPGQTAVVMPLGGHRLSAAICYEVVYPDLIAAFVAGGSQLLTTITNDAWYGHTSAPYQHFWQAVVRSVEQGRYLVRAANTGISGLVDPYGRVLAMSPIFERTVVVGDVRFLDSRTVYARTGDVFAYACALLTLLVAATIRRR
ncbi:MAG: apolipoprotein N-acyltransferase [Acidobacteria bacterium]|nr:apolipoprotein N-acyltransferase [Acidobacteriota bacterium]